MYIILIFFFSHVAEISDPLFKKSALLLNRVPVVDIDPEAGGWE